MTTSIRCGKCKETHTSSAEVRACYADRVQAAPDTTHSYAAVPPRPNAESDRGLINWAATQTWSEFAVDVARKARLYGGLTDGQRRALLSMRTKVEARKPAVPQDLPDVPAGHYALEDFEGQAERFFRVDRPTEGQWAGRTFVKEQASDEFYPVRGDRARAVLEAVKADADAGPRYGRTIGRCYVCNRTLTDDLSRELGIGPVCRSR